MKFRNKVLREMKYLKVEFFFFAWNILQYKKIVRKKDDNLPAIKVLLRVRMKMSLL